MTNASSGVPEDRLDSWKEIALFLRRDVTTVQRWEKREGMPVHRHVHDKLGSVYASRVELDAWARSRNLGVTRNETEADALTAAPTADGSPSNAVARSIEFAPSGDIGGAPRARSRRRVAWRLLTVTVLVLAGTVVWLRERTEFFWRNPVAEAHFQHVTDFDGVEQAAAISRDGRFVAFQSDRDGPMDVWLTQVGTGRFYNLTRGRVQELVNSSVRTLGFSPDSALVTFWARRTDETGAGKIGVWAIPVLGGDPQPYLAGVAEFDWSGDGTRLVYHTAGAGDPTFVRDSRRDPEDRPIFTAAAGLHAHFPIWSSDKASIYFVLGEIPSGMDIWRIKASGGATERITHHNSQVSYPVWLNARTLMYLATDADGSGPWLYTIDVEKRIPHRVSSGLDTYASVAASADGQRFALTLTRPKETLWRIPLADTLVGAPEGAPIALTTVRGSAPRLGPNYLVYVSSSEGKDSILKVADGTATEIWTAPESRVVGGPEIDPDGRRIAFSVEQHGKTLLYVTNSDGTDARMVTASLNLRGSPGWSPDGRSITAAATVNGIPRLFRISLSGSAVALGKDYALDPVWATNGEFVVYSGADIGTTFPLKAAAADNKPYALPNLILTRGARRVRFLDHRRALIVMRGDIQHKDLWLIDLEAGAERQLTHFPPDFNILDFDVSRDGREVVLERLQEQSDVVLLERP